MLSWLVSAMCMAAIVGIYLFLKDRPASDIGDLLTYTNVLGKIASAALILPTSEALGQLKWNWFHNSKAMWDFEIFDKASRGPWGAIMLLFRTKGRSLAALGALLIVLLLAIDTFFQQVVELPERRIIQEGSAIPRLSRYRPEYLTEYSQGYETQQYDTFAYVSARPFFYTNGTQPIPSGNGTRPEIPLICPTSTCEWPAYETLGVCSECADISDSLEWKCLYTKIDWTTSYTGPVKPETTPNGTVCGFFLDGKDYGPVLMSGYIVNETETSQTPGEALLVRVFPMTDFLAKIPVLGGSIKFKHTRNAILDALIVSSEDAESVYQRKMPTAQECVLSWCVKTIESSYESGQYRENIRSTYQNTTEGPSPWTSIRLPDINNLSSVFVIYEQNVTIDRDRSIGHINDKVISNNTYDIDNITAANFQTMFDSVFPSYYTDHGPSGKPMLRYKDYYVGASFRELYFNPWQAPNNVTRHYERLATSLTNSIRSSTSVEWLRGAAYSKETFVAIKWEWLSFPFILLLLSLVFLIATMVKTSGDGATGVWKTSAMPTLIYSLPKEAQQQLTSSSTWGSGKGASTKTRIKLLPDVGWRVSGHSYLSRSPRLPSGERVPRGWI